MNKVLYLTKGISMKKMYKIFSKDSPVQESEKNCVLFLLFAYIILILCLLPFIYFNHNSYVIVFSLFYLLYLGSFIYTFEDTDLRNTSIFNMYLFNLVISPIILFLFKDNILILFPFLFVSVPLAIVLKTVKNQLLIGYLSIFFKFILTVIYLTTNEISTDINLKIFIYELFLIVIYCFFIIGFLRNSQYSIKRESLQLVKLLNKDSLTQLYNRRYFDETHSRYCNLCYYALVDIDHFKKINDQYGHSIGDFILCEVSKIFLKYKTEGVKIIRYGGDEFLFIFENISIKSVKIKMNLIRYDIEHLELGSDIIEEPVTISCGVTRCHKNKTMVENFKLVDDALYKAKEEGRNMVKIII